MERVGKMKIVVFGVGVIGVILVWYLVKVGYEVMVIDRQFGFVFEISFVNVGEILFGYFLFWVVLGILLKVLKWMFQCYVLLVLQLCLDVYWLGWMVQMLVNCIYDVYVVNKSCMVCIVEYSCDCFDVVCVEIGIEYDQCMQGMLQVFCKQEQLDGVGKDIEVLCVDGVLFEVLDCVGCVVVELGLVGQVDRIVGGLWLLGDEIGDCFKFINCLVEMVEVLGVLFCWGMIVQVFEVEGGCISVVVIDQGCFIVDRYVLVMGLYLLQLVWYLGLKLLIYLFKGYLLIIFIVDEGLVLVLMVMDEIYKVVIIWFGDCIWVGGLVEIVGYDLMLNDRCCVMLMKFVIELFGGVGDFVKVIFWIGLCLMILDGMFIVGVMLIFNLFLNIGYGMLGWIMLVGLGCLLLDLILGCGLDIEFEDLGYVCYLKGVKVWFQGVMQFVWV